MKPINLYKLRIGFVIFAALFWQSAFAQTDSPGPRLASNKGMIKVPFDLFENNILVQVRINKSQPIWCIFDTGAGVNVLNAKLAGKLGLSNSSAIKLNGGGGSVEGTVINDASVSISGAEAFRQRIALVSLDMLPQYFGRRVEGIIGTDFIKNFVIEIDHVNKTLTFFDYKTYNLSKEPGTTAIYSKDNVQYTEIELSLDGQKAVTADFELDTGSGRTLQINKPFADKNQILNIVPKSKTLEGTGGAGVGGATSFVDARISGLRIGKYTLKNPVVGISQDTQGTGAGEDTGVIGTEIFRRFTLVLDYRSQKILLKPNKYFNDPFESDMSGLELVTGENNFKEIRVRSVKQNFPASRAGLQAGDELIKVNGRPTTEFDLDKLSKMLRQPGREYALSIRRQSRIIKVKLKLERYI